MKITTLKDSLKSYSRALSLDIIIAHLEGNISKEDNDQTIDDVDKIIDRVLGEYLGEK